MLFLYKNIVYQVLIKNVIYKIVFWRYLPTRIAFQLNKHQRIPKGQYKQDNPEKLATWDTRDEDKQNKNTAQYVWIPLCVNKHK